jgi:hypothetical protein
MFITLGVNRNTKSRPGSLRSPWREKKLMKVRPCKWDEWMRWERSVGYAAWVSLWVLAAATIAVDGSLAQEASSRRWADLIQKAEANLAPERIPSSAPERHQLETAIRSLETFLATSPTQGQKWREFLKLDAVATTLSEGDPNLGVLNEVEKRFRQNYPGLEMLQFTRARDALARYVRSHRFAAKPENTMTILRNRLQRLLTRSQSPEGLGDVEGLHDLAQVVTYLHDSNQAPELVSALRASHANANACVYLGSDVIEQRFARQVNQYNPINEVILGTSVRGQGYLTGSVAPRLLDSPTQAALRLSLRGDFQGTSRGFNRSVVLNTSSQAGINASESIALTENGLVSLGDTFADADLRTRINSIEHRLKIVRKIAAKEAAKRKPQADRVSLVRLENRIRREFHEQIVTQLSEANAQIQDAAKTELARLGIDRPQRSSWSTRDWMGLVWNVRNHAQLAAPSPCALPLPAQGITFQLHQSLVGNLLDPVLAGRVIRSEDMDGYLSQFGELAKRIPRKEDEGSWSITLQGFQPVEILLDNSLIRFRIRVSRLDREDNSLAAATIDAAYRIEIIDGRIQLHREGDINIAFSESQQKGVKAVALRTFLKGKFEQIFRPQLLDEPLNWSEKLPDQFQDLRIADLTIDDGWMQVHLQ